MKVSLIMAQTLDGVISRTSTEFIDWTGSADKKFFKNLTKLAGVVVMGSRTYDTIGRPLPGRKNVVMSRNTKRVSTTSDLIFTSQKPQEILDDLLREGYNEVAVIGGTEINTVFAQLNLITDIYLTIAPRVFGQGLHLFKEPLDLRLRLLSSTVLAQDCLLLHYQVLQRAARGYMKG